MEYTLNKRIIVFIGLFFIMCPIFAGCGSCAGDNTNKSTNKSLASDSTIRSNALVVSVPNDGNIEGLVMASCGKCNFGYKKNSSCSLTIKVGNMVYPVEGTTLHNHGDAHSSEGFCSAVRVAYTSGKIKKNTFFSDSFSLLESPKK